MEWPRRLTRRIRLLFHKTEVERELDDELAHHLELEARELERRGMDPREARREARRRFGGVEGTKERVRDDRGGRLAADLLQDVAYGLRALRRSPTFTASALLVLALGIGASTALFGVVRGVLLRALPFPEPDRLVRVWPASPGRGIERAAFSYPDFRDWRAEASSLAEMGLYTELPADYPILGDAGPEEVETVWIGGDFFGALGVGAAEGRTIRPRDVEEGLAVVVLSHGFWQRRYARAAWMDLYRRILERAEALPSVREAGAIRYLPFRGEGEAWPVRIPGIYEPAAEEQRYARAYQVSRDLFAALDIPLLRGRSFRRTDGEDDPFVAVVNRAFVADFFHGRDPVGRRIRVVDEEIEVVGVVGDVRHAGLREKAPPVLYVHQPQRPRIQMSYVLEADGDPLALADDVRRIVHELDPDQAIAEITPLARLLDEETARPRFYSLVLGLFAALAVVLAALGVYGVLAWVVRNRAREMGLRMALGASAREVVRMVVGRGLAPVGVGLAVGLAGAAALTHLVESLLFGVPAADPLTYAAVAGLVAVTGVAACLGPALWALRIDPMERLRAE